MGKPCLREKIAGLAKPGSKSEWIFRINAGIVSTSVVGNNHLRIWLQGQKGGGFSGVAAGEARFYCSEGGMGARVISLVISTARCGLR